jgi:rsbT co-antagonist protein RsbR
MNDPSTFSVDPSEWRSFGLLQTLIDALDDPIFVKDMQHRWIAGNHAFFALLGQPREMLLGHSDPEFFPPDQVEVFWRVDDEVTSSGSRHEIEEDFTDADGNKRRIWTRKFPIKDAQGNVVGLCGIITNITEIKRRQQEVERLEADIQDKLAIIGAQESLLDQISVPVIQVWDSILLLPLIGVIDSRRATQVLEGLLESIERARAQVIIIDITGVPVVDTSIARYLVQAMQAAQLLGCQSILVGISPEIAQTLVGLGVDFSRIKTLATLQSGLEYALKRLNYVVNSAEIG